MPYRKRNYKRRARPTTMKKIAHKEAIKVVKNNIEAKKAYQEHSYIQLDYYGKSYALYPTGQGVTDQQYIGQKINIKRIHIRGNMEVVDQFNNLRLLVVQWKGTPPTNTVAGGNCDEVLWGTGNIHSYLEDLNDGRHKRYRVLHDKTYLGNQFVIGNNICVNFKIDIAKKLRPTTYYDANGVVQDGEVRLYMLSDSSNLTAPIISWRGTVYYTDA